MKNLVILLILSLFLVSCSDKEEEVVTPCGKSGIRYLRDIKPIISKNCASCHKEYLVYDNLNMICNNGKFHKRVIYLHDMPPTGMDTCDILTLKSWYYNGHTSY